MRPMYTVPAQVCCDNWHCLLPSQDLRHYTLRPSNCIRTCTVFEALTDRQHSLRGIELIEVSRLWAGKMVHSWTNCRGIAPLGLDLCGHFRRGRCQAVAKELVPSRCDTTIPRCLSDSARISWLYQSRGLWCPRRCGRADRARVGEIPEQWVKEVSPVATIQDLYAGHRQRGAKAIMSSAADRCEMPCRGSSTMACSQHRAAATSESVATQWWEQRAVRCRVLRMVVWQMPLWLVAVHPERAHLVWKPAGTGPVAADAGRERICFRPVVWAVGPGMWQCEEERPLEPVRASGQVLGGQDPGARSQWLIPHSPQPQL
eukprot:4501132-Amphidinium_carterae.2